MARVWYHRRRERKAGGFGQSLHQEEKKPLCHDREETQGFKARHLKKDKGLSEDTLLKAAASRMGVGAALPPSALVSTLHFCAKPRAPGLADSTEFAGQFTERPKAKIDPKFKPQQFFERLRQFVEGPLKSCEGLPRFKEEDVSESCEARQALRALSAGRVGGSGEAFQARRLQPSDSVGQAPKSPTVPLSGECDIGGAPKRGTRKGSSKSGFDTSSTSSDFTGQWELADRMASHSRGRSLREEAFWRRSTKLTARDELSEIHERARKNDTESTGKRLWQRRPRGTGTQQRGQRQQALPERQGQEQRQGADRCLNRAASEPECSSPFLEVVQSLEAGNGAFSRFWRLIKSSDLNRRSGPMTPSASEQKAPLFPSLLDSASGLH